MQKPNNKEVRPSDASVCQINLPSHPDRKVVARFDGGRLSSDAGLVSVWALDQQQRLTADFAACIQDVRDGRYIRHEISEMATQRSFQIVAGYEDCNDADSLRLDPIFKTVCSRLPEGDNDLACQSTLSRLENSVSRKDLFRIGEWFCDSYWKRRKKSKPKKITLDVDSTADPTHGQQELSFYHGFYREHIYHPLLIFDADTGDLITALLRPGNRGAASGVVSVLKRLVKKMRRRLGKKLDIEIRADSWEHPRRMIAKVEVTDLGLNRRFVVTNREDLSAQDLYEHYVDRGQAENFVKAFKKDLVMDRLSCHRFLANQFRLWLHALAYQLIVRLRDYLQGTPWQKLEVETLRRRLFKIGARVQQSSRRIWIHFASSYPEQELFSVLMQRLCPT